MRVRKILVWSLTVLVAVGLGLVAGWAAFAPPSVEQEPVQDPEYTVTEATVGRSISMSATGSWQTTDLAGGAAQGTVTSIEVAEGEEVQSGTVLLTVDLRPVTVAQGDTPGFRDLTRGLTGPDVQQLQAMLVELGYLTGETDDRFGPRTEQAVREWQRDLGITADGAVRAGDLLYAPQLPARILLAEDVVVGAQIAAGSVSAAVVSSAPTFELELSEAAMTPAIGMVVQIDGPGEEPWEAEVAEITGEETEANPSRATLQSGDGGPVCGHECDLVPAAGARYAASVEIVPSRTGPSVPLSAVGTAADGSTFVRGLNDERIEVELLVTDGSRAVVEGLEVDDRIRLFAEPGQDVENGE